MPSFAFNSVNMFWKRCVAHTGQSSSGPSPTRKIKRPPAQLSFEDDWFRTTGSTASRVNRLKLSPLRPSYIGGCHQYPPYTRLVPAKSRERRQSSLPVATDSRSSLVNMAVSHPETQQNTVDIYIFGRAQVSNQPPGWTQ